MATSAAPPTLTTGDLHAIALDEAKAESPVEDVASASSTATEVRDVSSSDGEVVNADGSTPTPESPVEPFKLALPPAVETATSTALAAVQEWWATVEPLLRQLQAQLMVQMKPLLQASADGLKRLAPHTQQAADLVAEWKAKLEPSTQAVIASVQQATEKVRIHAYEPALAAVIAASAAVREFAITTAALVQKRAAIGYKSGQEWWIAQQPMLQEAQAAAAKHAAAALVALEAWRKQLEPLVLAQLMKAGEQAKVLGEHAKVAAVKLGEDGKVVAAKAGAWASDKQNWVDVATKVCGGGAQACAPTLSRALTLSLSPFPTRRWVRRRTRASRSRRPSCPSCQGG